VAAKDGSQETAVNLTGLCLSLLFMPWISEDTFLIWTLFFIFTLLHLFCNYNAVKGVVLESLNRQRTSLLISWWINNHNPTSIKAENIPTPDDINKIEKVLWWDTDPIPIVMGSSLKTILNNEILGKEPTDLVQHWMQSAQQDKFLLFFQRYFISIFHEFDIFNFF
jgi:hypothetical protein